LIGLFEGLKGFLVAMFTLKLQAFLEDLLGAFLVLLGNFTAALACGARLGDDWGVARRSHCGR
jgi:hypothetical protein